MKVYFNLEKRAITDVDNEDQVIFTGDVLTSELQVISDTPTTDYYVTVSAKLSNGRTIGPFLADVGGIITDEHSTTWKYTLSSDNGFTLAKGITNFYIWLMPVDCTNKSQKCLGAVVVNVGEAFEFGDDYFIAVDEEDEEQCFINMKAQVKQLQQLINSVTTIEANPSESASADLIKIKIGSVTYGVSLVKANPSGTPTNTLLRTISINGVIYSTNGDYPELIVIPNTLYTFGDLIGTEHPYSYACYLTTWEHNGLYHLDYTTQGTSATLKITSFKDGFKEIVYEDEATTLWSKKMTNIIAGVDATKIDTLANKQDKITSSNKIGADLVAETTAKQFISASEKGQIATNTNNIILLGTSVDATGHKVELTINPTTYVLTLTLKDKNNNTLSTASADLPLETMVVNGTYNDQTKKVVLTLQNGNTIEFSVASLVSGLQETLVAGVNIRYINGQNILMGAGDSSNLALDTVYERTLTSATLNSFDSEEKRRLNTNPSSIVFKFAIPSGEVVAMNFHKKETTENGYVLTYYSDEIVTDGLAEDDELNIVFVNRYKTTVTYSNIGSEVYNATVVNEDTCDFLNTTGSYNLQNHVIQSPNNVTQGSTLEMDIDNNTIFRRDGLYFRKTYNSMWTCVKIDNTYYGGNNYEHAKSFKMQEHIISVDNSSHQWSYYSREPLYEVVITVTGNSGEIGFNEKYTLDEFTVFRRNNHIFRNVSYGDTDGGDFRYYECLTPTDNGILVERISIICTTGEWTYTSYTYNDNKSLYHLGAYDSADGKTRQTGYVDLGSLDWFYEGDRFKSSVIDIPAIKNYQNVFSTEITSSRYVGNPSPIGDKATDLTISYYNPDKQFYLVDKSCNTVEQLKQVTQSVIVQYKLATSYTDNPIENQSLLPLDTNMANKIRQEVVDGLNLFDINNSSQFVVGNLEGTSTDRCSTGYVVFVKAGTYTIKPINVLQPYAVKVNSYYTFDKLNGDIYVDQEWNNANTEHTITIAQDGYLGIQFQCAKSALPSNVQIMLNEGSQTYPYSDFNQKEHITNDEATLLKQEEEKCRNLWNKDSVVEGYWISAQSGNVVSSNVDCYSNYYIEVNGQSKISAYFDGNSNNWCGVCFYDSNKTFISGVEMGSPSNSRPITTSIPSNCKYIRVSSAITNKGILMVNFGDQEPYHEYCGKIVHTTEAFEAVGGSKNLCSSFANNNWRFIMYGKLEPNTTYHFTTNDTSGAQTPTIKIYSLDGTLLQTVKEGAYGAYLIDDGFTTNGSVNGNVKVEIGINKDYSNVTWCMLNKGSTPLLHKEFTGNIVFEKDLEEAITTAITTTLNTAV